LFRNVYAAAQDHKPRLIGKGRGVHTGVGAGGACGRVLNRQSRDARRDAGNALDGTVIVARRAVCGQRQRGLLCPNGIERQVRGRHHNTAAWRVICVSRGCSGVGVPTEEIVAVTRERVCVHREACAHGLRRAVAGVAARQAAVAIVAEGKERLLGVDHHSVIFYNAAERIAVANIRCCVNGRAVVGHACDFIASR